MFCKQKTRFTFSIHLELSKGSAQFHSGDCKRCCPVDDNHGLRENFCTMDQKARRISSCGGVVGADEPLQVGSSSRKRLRGLADGSERGLGQRPKALRKICNFSISFLSFFQLGKRTWLDGSTLLSRSGSKYKRLIVKFLSKLDSCSHRHNALQVCSILVQATSSLMNF